MRPRGNLYEVVTSDNPGRASPKRSTKPSVAGISPCGSTTSTMRRKSTGLDPYMLRQSQGLGLNHPNLLKFFDIDLVLLPTGVQGRHHRRVQPRQHADPAGARIRQPAPLAEHSPQADRWTTLPHLR